MNVASHDPSRRSVLVAAAITIALSGCGGSAEPPKDAAQETRPPPKVDIGDGLEEPKEEPVVFPTACSNEGEGICVPPKVFVEKLCAAGKPELSLAMFAKGTPWVRGYLARATEAWDASGGPSSSNKLEFDEEVLILVKRTPNTGGMVVSGATGSYDVLRWNGSCASLQAEELRMRVPPEPLHAAIPWRKLDDDVQQALLKDEKIATRAAEQKKECKGVSRGQTNTKCEKAQKALGKAIVAFVRRGGALPPPQALP
ncbi:hypothetical protein [Polyangium spumosum]|uniref:Uncharacterized protein n=1 Tax=Polyangium spumosum TaxID=889282 RepID=A0A6N7PZV0_9BACT|nr:hypothetical protein [Polyangium spumosum]MRG96416.1 hypothetical protein [Polyangium spumosum]